MQIVERTKEGGLTPDKILELKGKHGADLVRLVHAGHVLVFRKASMPEWSRFVQQIGTDDKRHNRLSVMKRLCQDCFVYPEGADGRPDIATLNSFFDQYPGAISIAMGEISEISGGGETIETGKL